LAKSEEILASKHKPASYLKSTTWYCT